jgi:hypothetical protein
LIVKISVANAFLDTNYIFVAIFWNFDQLPKFFFNLYYAEYRKKKHLNDL